MTRTLAPAVLTLAPSALGGVLDDAWRPEMSSAPTLRIDMRKAAFIDVSGMQYLCARIAERAAAGQDTALALPDKREVREHLRNWRFPQAAAAAAGARGFRSLVEPASLRYFGERLREPGSAIGHQDEESGQLPPHYFPIRSRFAVGGVLDPELAAQETRQWQSRYLLTVLNGHLNRHGRRIATHVVHEAIINAIRHPGARILQTGSLFQDAGKPPADGSEKRTARGSKNGLLTIVIWDDGESIIDTMRAGAVRQGRLVPHGDPCLHRDFVVKLVDLDDMQSTFTTRSDAVATSGSSDDALLLAALFPGVTSRPDQEQADSPHHMSAEDRNEDGDDDKPPRGPGMGLHVLSNTVLDVFGGTVAIRTGHYFANFKPSRQPSRGSGLPPVAVKVARRTTAFYGNMITLRIPLRPYL